MKHQLKIIIKLKIHSFQFPSNPIKNFRGKVKLSPLAGGNIFNYKVTFFRNFMPKT